MDIRIFLQCGAVRDRAYTVRLKLYVSITLKAIDLDMVWSSHDWLGYIFMEISWLGCLGLDKISAIFLEQLC